MGPMSPEVAVVVPTFERPDRLRRLVAALEQQTAPRDEWELVVVDDGSGDETPAVLAELRRSTSVDLRVERLPHNQGPAMARNVGWRSTSAPLLAFTDDDCVPEPGWLAAGVTALRSGARTGIVQGRTLHADIPAGARHTWRTVVRDVPAPSPWFEGCNLFARRDALEAAGGFDEEIGWFGEETALGWEVLERGWRRGWAPAAVVRHDIFDRPLKWHLRNRYLEGNLVRIAATHPLLRDAFWRRWAITREGALFAGAVVGAGAGLRWRPAALLVVPYAISVQRDVRRVPPSFSAFRVVCSATSLAGKLVAAARWRILVL